MASGSFAADEASDAGMPDQRLTLILAMLHLHRAAIPEPVVLHRIAEDVRQAELRASGYPAAAATLAVEQRVMLCAEAVRRFVTART